MDTLEGTFSVTATTKSQRNVSSCFAATANNILKEKL